ncbi:MAG: type II toxin-antitoxin system RelE/ParE family toxin [Candidatus Yanofskybacteria bacterium]|nr:type II toxin-antitoxin system RelE/ParE family toxin [Candidatus Yanofskybacteria bacterium]
MWSVVVRKSAEKQLDRLSKSAQVKIILALETFKSNPFSGDIANLKDSIWRRRVGSYRITFELIKFRRIIYVIEIKRRTTTTYS